MSLHTSDYIAISGAGLSTIMAVINMYLTVYRQRERLTIRREKNSIVIANTGSVSVSVMRVKHLVEGWGAGEDFLVGPIRERIEPNAALNLQIVPTALVFLGLEPIGFRIIVQTATGRTFSQIIRAPEYAPKFPQMLADPES